MSRLLRALAWVSPSAAISRAQALSSLERAAAYEGANTGRRQASFKSSTASANGALSSSLTRLRGRSRDMVRNTWIGARMIDVLVAHVIGTGIGVTWNTGSDRTDKQAQALWDRWCRQADIEGELDFSGLQMVAFRSMCEGGDSFLRMIPRRLDDLRAVPFALKVGEGDFIDETRDGRADGRRVRMGVVLGEWDARSGYYMHREHPGEMGLLGAPAQSVFVPREEVCHLYRPLRAGQVRGVPVMAPILMTSRDFADLMDALVVKARMEACFGIAVKSNGTSTSLAKSATDKSGNRIEQIKPGMATYLEPGEDIVTIAPSGSGQFEPVSLAALMGCAAGGMITYDQLTGDLRRANYSSLRAGKIEFRRLVEQLQWLVLVPMMMDRICDQFIEYAILAGKLRPRKDGYNRDYVMPAHEPIDPKKDLEADILAVRAGRMSPQEFITAWGRDWRKVAQDHEDFWKLCDERGLVLDIDPRRVSQAGLLQSTGYASDDLPQPQDD